MANLRFKENELKRLRCTEEEIEVVMEYQKQLPILVENEECEGFCIDLKDLHKQVGSKRHYADWVKDRIKKYKFVENKDYITTSQKCDFVKNGYKYINKYTSTIDMAEHLALVERNEIEYTVREYFRIMRTILRRNKEWIQVRNEERKNYKPLCDALSQCIYKQCGRYGDKFDFAREANILNLIATGCKASEIRLYLSITKSRLTRDGLEKDYNEKLAFLQDQDILLCGLGLPLLARVEMLINMFDIKYPNGAPLQDYLTRDDLLKARTDLLNELKK